MNHHSRKATLVMEDLQQLSRGKDSLMPCVLSFLLVAEQIATALWAPRIMEEEGFIFALLGLKEYRK